MPFLIIVLFLFSSFSATSARAEASIGDSAMTVAFATIGGAVLGASTLPFYEESGEHTKNIFYGAALGAVAGVLISAYAGVKEGPAYEEEGSNSKTNLRRRSARALNESPEFRLHAEASTATIRPAGFGGGAPLYWTSIAGVSF